LVAFALYNTCFAHTWIQCTDYKTDGSCSGFIRNYYGRTVPGGGSTDEFYTNKLLGQDPNFLVCKSDTQATATYSASFPKASVRAGTTLKTMYTPNGHSADGDVGRTTFTRIHWNKGPNGPSTPLTYRRDLNASNELSRTNYAINCQTTGDVASLPCVNSFTIPSSTPPGTYQFVWYWPYNKNPTQVPFGEEYYSCFEINVLATDAVLPSSAPIPSSAPSSAPATPKTSKSSSPVAKSSVSEEQISAEETEDNSKTLETNSKTDLLDVASHSSKLVVISLFFYFLI